MVFLFKQKTAYEMRISDWSSDVCSSDLVEVLLRAQVGRAALDHRDAAIGRERFVPGVDRDETAVVRADDARIDRQRNLERRLGASGEVAIEILLVHEDVAARLQLGEDAEVEVAQVRASARSGDRSEEHTSELQSLMRNTYA